jgi:hypothetical protein
MRRDPSQACGLHDDVDRGNRHLPDSFRGQGKATHRDHGLDAGERFARTVGMQRAHRAVVTCIHRLKQVE